MAAPGLAKTTDLIYVETPKHLDRAAESRAACVLVKPGLALEGKTLLRSSNPKLAFARAAGWLLPPAPIATGVHPTAVIAPSAKLAGGVAIGPYVVIEDDVQVGSGTQIGAFCYDLAGTLRRVKNATYIPRVTLYAGAHIANRVILHAGGRNWIGRFGFTSRMEISY